MSDEAIKYVIFAVILVVAILVTWFLAIAYRKNVAEAKLGKAEDKRRISFGTTILPSSSLYVK